jgi:hypothetical protein
METASKLIAGIHLPVHWYRQRWREAQRRSDPCSTGHIAAERYCWCCCSHKGSCSDEDASRQRTVGASIVYHCQCAAERRQSCKGCSSASCRGVHNATQSEGQLRGCWYCGPIVRPCDLHTVSSSLESNQ